MQQHLPPPLRRYALLVGLCACALLLLACVPPDDDHSELPAQQDTPPRRPPAHPLIRTPRPPTPAHTPVPMPARSADAAVSDPAAVAALATAIDAMQIAPSFHAEIDAAFKSVQTEASFRMDEETFGTEFPFEVTGDFQADGRMSGTVSLAQAGATTALDVVSIGDATYIRSPDAIGWDKFLDADGVFPNLHELVRPPTDISRYTAAQFAGERAVDGIPVQRIRAELDAVVLGSAFERLECELWVSESDGLVHRMTMAGETSADAQDTAGLAGGGALGAADIGGDVEFTMTVRYTDFGKPLDIQPPAGF